MLKLINTNHFEIVCDRYNYDGKLIVKSIKYSPTRKKDSIKLSLILEAIFLVGALFFFVFHFFRNDVLVFSIMLVILSLVYAIIFGITYAELKGFCLCFEKEGIYFRCLKTSIVLKYNDLVTCGIISRVGSGTLIGNDSHRSEENQSTFAFVSKDEADIRKTARHMRISGGVNHKYYKGSFCICDYSNSLIFAKLVDTINYYCSDYPVKIALMDRKDIGLPEK